MSSEKAESSPQAQGAQEGRIAAAPGRMSAEIRENNTDLTARIANAINLANSVAGITQPGANQAPSVVQLESLLPYPGRAASASSLPGSNVAGVAGFMPPWAFQQQQQVAGGQQQFGVSPVNASAVAGGVPAPLPGMAGAPLAGQELSLLSLLSSNSNFLSPSDMALPLNDPSVFLPTPFAPGESANSLQPEAPAAAAAHAAASIRALASTPDSVASFASIPFGMDAIRSASVPSLPGVPRAVTMPGGLPMAAHAALPGMISLSGGQVAMPGHHFGVTAMAPQPVAAPMSFLQQLAAAYAAGGGGGGGLFAPQAMAREAAAPAPAAIPAALMSGLLGQPVGGMPANALGALGVPAAAAGIDLNTLLAAGYHPGARAAAALNPVQQAATLNPAAMAGYNAHVAANGAAGFNAALNSAALSGLPGIGLLVPGTLHAAAAGLGGLTNANLAGQRNNSTAAPVPSATDSPTTPGALGAAAAAGATTALPDGIDAQAKSSATAEPEKRRGTKASKKSSTKGGRGGGGGGGGDPLIKSREARWIIRYNELLEFQREHGHCRVPHGYAPNRKLSWWVMNQRAQFAHRNQGKKTWLSADRIQLLNDIGFIWCPHLKKSGVGGGGKKKREKSESSENAADSEEDTEREGKRRKSEYSRSSQADEDGNDDDSDNDKQVKTEEI